MEKNKICIDLTLPAPAKINHFLHIVGQRKDGYHLLQTLFQFLDYSDFLHFTLRQDSYIEIKPDNIAGISTQENLIYRAALALQQQANIKQGITIHLEKNLPLGAGLGGGSSNAATTLIALNFLWKIYWPLSRLQTLGLTLGADVPIFIEGRAAWAEGIGEQLTPVELPEPWVLVINPSCHVSTPQMYADRNLTRNTPRFKIGSFGRDEINSFLAGLKNDFEPIVRRYYPEVNDAIQWLSQYGKARLSGSGASVFACFPSEKQAQEIAQQLPPRFKGFVARGTNTSPLVLAIKRSDIK